MPRRKYGHLIHALPVPKPKEKCRYCQLGWKCPIHKDGEVQETSMSRKDIKKSVKGRGKKKKGK